MCKKKKEKCLHYVESTGRCRNPECSNCIEGVCRKKGILYVGRNVDEDYNPFFDNYLNL